MSNSGDFVHLHVHTDFSLLEGSIRLKPLAKRLSELEMSSCAITDYANLYGAISFYTEMMAAGIKPIIGYEANLLFGDRTERSAAVGAGELPFYNVLLFAKDHAGYLNLVNLASKAFTEGFFKKPRIDLGLLGENSGGLVCVSAGLKGPVGHFLTQGDRERARKNASLLKEIFSDDLFLEIQDHGLDAEEKLLESIGQFSNDEEIPLVATNDAHYLFPEDARAHSILLCIGEGRTINDPGARSLGSEEFFLRSKQEMWDLFGDRYPEALENTIRIADMCELEIPLKDNLALPKYPVPGDSGCTSIDEYFEKVAREGFEERKRSLWDRMAAAGELRHPIETYEERLRDEIRIVEEMGFPGYFLIVWEFVRYAKENGIPVGPGRGSAAGSLAAFCLDITDIDPIQYDLLFERFLNPERISMPDIDIDFCVKGRAKVIEHVSEFYGSESVCQIITFGTMASRAAIKDVGRALDIPYTDVEKIAKLIPPPIRGRNVSIGAALEMVPELSKAVASDPRVKELVDLALRLEGCARHTSVHAAGVVISPEPLHRRTPVALSSRNDELTSQYPMNDLEKVGMLKMDFLALTTLTIINDCLKSIKRRTGEEVNWGDMPLDDKETLRLFAEGRTDAVFQFESGGMQEICRKLKPKELEDLAALNALYRPGPIDGGMIDDFIARHKGEKPVRYIVPGMKEILENTYGILVYQEQIMQLARNLAGYSLGEADKMRRAMGKKKRKEMEVHEEKFISGAVKRGIEHRKASEIFQLMAQFADYGFNRSHSMAYAYIAYQTAYLKAHYPAYFYAAVLSYEANDSAKIYKHSNEMAGLGVELLPPDVNESDAGFTPLGEGVRFGLAAIKGIGGSSVDSIIEARKRGGRFSSIFDFTARLAPGSVNRRGLESLVCAGAFDTLDPQKGTAGEDRSLWRARLYNVVVQAIAHGHRISSDREMGQSGLFGAGAAGTVLQEELPEATRWTSGELSANEKHAVGFYLSSHPLDPYTDFLDERGMGRIASSSSAMPGDQIELAGMISRFQLRNSRKGNRFCIFRLEDQSTGVKCLGWSDVCSKYAGSLADDELVIAKGRVESNDGQEITLIVDEVESITDLVYKTARSLIIGFPDTLKVRSALDGVFKVLSGESGGCEVILDIGFEKGLVARLVSEPIRVTGSKRLEDKLEELGCTVTWDFGTANNL